MSDTTRLDEIRQREAAATEGPWQQNGSNGVHIPRGICVAITQMDSREQRKADAEFLAAARVDVPWLVAEVERLRDENDAMLTRCATLHARREAAVVERDAALAEVEVLRAELREATKSTLGWRQWVMRGRDEAVAERDAALAAVTRVRSLLHDTDGNPLSGDDFGGLVGEMFAALGTVGQPQEDPSE